MLTSINESILFKHLQQLKSGRWLVYRPLNKELIEFVYYPSRNNKKCFVWSFPYREIILANSEQEIAEIISRKLFSYKIDKQIYARFIMDKLL